MPLSDQFTLPPKNKNGKTHCSFRLAKLRGDRSIKICGNENVVPRVPCNLLSVIPGLKPFCFFVYAVPDEGCGDLSANHSMLSGEMNNCDHSVIWVSQATFRNAVAYSARLFSLCGSGQYDHRHMTVSCGMLVSIDVDEVPRIVFPDG